MSCSFHCILMYWGLVFGLLAQGAAFLSAHQPMALGRSYYTERDNVSFQRTSNICMARPTAQGVKKTSWFPPRRVYDDDIFAQDDDMEELEERSINLIASLMERRIRERRNGTTHKIKSSDAKFQRVQKMVEGRFLDLTCTEEGEEVLERMFECDEAAQEDGDVVRGAVIALQSLLIMGTQVGVKGPPKQLEDMVSHLWRRNDEEDVPVRRDVDVWDRESVRRLKYNVDQRAGYQILIAMKRKRSTQGAFDLLVHIGAWEQNEDIFLLRSGFPTKFTESEVLAAEEASLITHDPDSILGIRQDLRRQKVYTIDSASTTEIDDGLSVEVISNEDGTTRQRYWIHIADAERWVPRSSAAFEIATRRVTSLYLPSKPVPMFPLSITDLMSLQAKKDLCAMSLGVELLPDGSIDASSIVVTPSRIMVDYRLSYEEVDEMLEEGVGYNEEWQLGALLAAATKRRNYRIKNGSSEGMIPNPMPQTIVTVFPDQKEPWGLGISIRFEASNNVGTNQTEIAQGDSSLQHATPVSQASLLVTEMMILAGEAIGKWKTRCDDKDRSEKGSGAQLENSLTLPFRAQPRPDYKLMQKEVQILSDLREGMQGGGYCHAWYARRFFEPVIVSDLSNPHFGLGLDCYVQWTSPIRRLSDLQVHVATKRYLRREKINELVKTGTTIPSEIKERDLGCPVPVAVEGSTDEDGRVLEYDCKHGLLDGDLSFNQGMGLMRVSRQLQRQSKDYWVFEHLKRRMEENPEGDAVFDAVVLGCVNPDKLQYAVFIHEVGLEHRYVSEVGPLRPGMTLSLRVLSVYPRCRLLTFTLANP